MQKVLVLGAGLVSRPIVQYFLDHDGRDLTVATLYVEDAQRLIGDRTDARAVALDVTDAEQVDRQVSAADLVVSLVPFHLHAEVARIAVARGVNLVTTSYVSPAMRELDAAAREAGVLLLNECGLDPGLDHMSAMRVIDRVHADDGKIISFESCTGGLPAPEAADNPWRYKFSWSPRGALVAGTHAARYLGDGIEREVPGPKLFDHAWPYDVHGLGRFEVYPNRDSIPYRDTYGLSDIDSMLRGTIRYPGWSRGMKAVADLGLLELEPREWPSEATYADLTTARLGPGAGSPRERVARHLDLDFGDDVLERLAFAGMFDDEPLGRAHAAPLDLVAKHVEQRMRYADGERDMVVMQHDFGIVRADGRHERQQSQLIAYGDPDGSSAISRTVSWPAAIAADLILGGRLPLTGVQIPTNRAIYKPILEGLESMGIVFLERLVSPDKNE
ncbi:MAG: saccharopine dehydrogenase [Acidobacteria bacterium]|nr:saccharopine dehydrogenase [Acidobacteriota bacterium]NIM61988.1 saccharopine dehydrogenase [Acidobacteriota bacterium]NIO58946.1 saccharopine dehydrogenase [Acidobacteriota bacterium]NIQ29992.1 saccharopine dehydrogenase [Acidobacteriota bacterium]NIQ84071.1 saccharopine dehydrogenase [Acidobacteriota bacterium]